MPLDLQAFGQSLASLKPIEVPSALDRYKTLAALKTQQLQQQDIAAQVQERQSVAQKDALAQQKQQRLAQILQNATPDDFDENGFLKPTSAVTHQLATEFPDVHGAMMEHAAKVASEAATAANQRGDLKVKQDTLAATQNKNLFDQMTKKDEQARKMQLLGIASAYAWKASRSSPKDMTQLWACVPLTGMPKRRPAH